MKIKLSPAKLKGTVAAVSSKSDVHRLLIAAALSDGETVIRCNGICDDIEATADCLNALGAKIEISDGKITVRAIEKPAEKTRIFKVMDDVLMKKTEYDATPRLTFTSDRQDYAICYPDIMYIRTAERNYLEIMQAPGTSYKTRLPFAGIQEELSQEKRFITLTRGVLVNLDFVSNVEGNVCILEDGERFPIASNISGNFRNIWQNYQLDSLRNERKIRRMGK